MEHRIVGLFSTPWADDLDIPRRASRDPKYLYRWAVWFKANPRGEDYMRELFAERYPQGEFINVDKSNEWRTRVRDADTIVLLYPDSVGLGFGRLEKDIGRLRKTWSSVRVLNGRRRDFLLNSGTVLGLRTRRILEWGMAGEMLALIPFIFMTPVLLAVDWVRGRR